jgi:hypothetical protein
VVQQLIEKCSEYGIPIFIGFIDYRKAFDSVEHPFLWAALKEQNIEDKYIRIFKKIYENSTAKIQLDKLGREFRLSRGIKQGCAVSPKFLNGALQKIINGINWDDDGFPINNEKIQELRFADDVVLVAKSKDEIQWMMEKLIDESAKAGLIINSDKTKIMSNTSDANFVVKHEIIEKVESYKYLGRIISIKNECAEEIDTRIRNGWKSFWSLKKYFKGNFPIFYKKKLLDTCILPVLSYGAQCWNITNEDRERLAVTQRRMERSMMNKQLNEISNSQLRKISKIKDVMEFTKEQKWKFAGHMQRLEDNRWSKKIERWVPSKKIKPGRPRMKWVDEIYEHDLNWRRNALRRETWKRKGKSFIL